METDTWSGISAPRVPFSDHSLSVMFVINGRHKVLVISRFGSNKLQASSFM